MIYLYDFEDSFTYNIYSEIVTNYPNVHIEVISKKRILGHLQTIATKNDKVALIFGPGPGHPNQYKDLEICIKRLMNKTNVYLMGICLGHQLLWQTKGLEVSIGYTPVHGQSTVYPLSKELIDIFDGNKEIEVQRYNSLTVKVDKTSLKELTKQKYKCLAVNDELILSCNERFLSYQFHPESIGTTCPKQFFKPLIEFLL